MQFLHDGIDTCFTTAYGLFYDTGQITGSWRENLDGSDGLAARHVGAGVGHGPVAVVGAVSPSRLDGLRQGFDRQIESPDLGVDGATVLMGFPVLAALVMGPVVGAVIIALIPKSRTELVLPITVTWTMLPLAVVFAALAGMLLGFPVLRMHGDYLAIVTLGFGEIIRLLLNNWIEFTGGPNGVSAPLPTLFGLEFKRRAVAGGIPFHEYFGLEYSSTYRFIFIYLILFITLWIVLYFKHRLVNMPVGRAWEALREDEIACRSLGLNHVLIKLSAFMIGASIGGVAGVFFATYQGFINPSSFTFIESALILAIVVLGGLGSTLGVAVAALVLTILPEALREFADYRVLIFGMLMVLMMIWKPRGLIRSSRPSFNLADEGK